MAFQTYPIPLTAIYNNKIAGAVGDSTQWIYGTTVKVYQGTPVMSDVYKGTVDSGTLALTEAGANPSISDPEQKGKAAITGLMPGQYTVLLNFTPSSPCWYMFEPFKNITNGPPAPYSQLCEGSDDDLSSTNTVDFSLDHVPLDGYGWARFNRMWDIIVSPETDYQLYIDTAVPKLTLNSTFGLDSRTVTRNSSNDIFRSDSSFRFHYLCYPGNT